METRFPFSAIIGQNALKMALILAAINPRVSGVLIRGETGSGKSTAVRAFARLLPEIAVTKDCPYSCDPHLRAPRCPACGNGPKIPFLRKARLVEFPLNATEERVLGGLDFSTSLRLGKAVFEPGLLALAHRGALYIDEVNLLPDHLADAILDAAGSGFNRTRREGVSVEHPSRFLLIGTMNPEEGELRPQLLDRFGLCVDVTSEGDIQSRMEILTQREEFDTDPHAFARRFEADDRDITQRIAYAASLLPSVRFPGALLSFIAETCLNRNAYGHRADIVTAHAAKAWAAWNGHARVTPEDVLEVAQFALAHRSRDTHANTGKGKSGAGHTVPPPPRTTPQEEEFPTRSPNVFFQRNDAEDADFGPATKPNPSARSPEVVFEVAQAFAVKPAALQRDRIMRPPVGKRSKTKSRQKRGRYIRSVAERRNDDVALDATLRAAAPHQLTRRSEQSGAVIIHEEDIREKVREARTRNFLLFMVDASGSMGAQGRMSASKGAIMSLLQDAYQKRDRVAMISFRNREAVVNLPPTSSIQRAARLLRELPTGGKTPLAAGLVKARYLLMNELIKDPACRPILIIITDGKANESVGRSDPFWEALATAKAIGADKRVKSVVVDAEETGGFRYNLSARLSRILRAEYCRIADLSTDHLLEIARKGSS